MVYRVCGILMAVCILLMTIHTFLPEQAAAALKGCHPIFWLDTTAILSFGISWLIKGEAILKDQVKEF